MGNVAAAGLTKSRRELRWVPIQLRGALKAGLLLIRRRIASQKAMHVHFDALGHDLVEFVSNFASVGPELKNPAHLLLTHLDRLLHLGRVRLKRANQALIKVLVLHQVRVAPLAHLLIKLALLPFEVICIGLGLVWHETFRLLNDPLKLAKTLTLLNLVHGLALQVLHFLPHLGEELLNQDGRSLLDQVGVDTADSVESAPVFVDAGVELNAKVLANEGREPHSIELLLEDASVANDISARVAEADRRFLMRSAILGAASGLHDLLALLHLVLGRQLG